MKSEEHSFDPLLHSFSFPKQRLFYPYGFPLLVRTNDERVLTAAEISFGSFSQSADVEPVRLDVAIVGDASGPFPAAPVMRSQDHLLWFVSDTAHFGTCEFRSGIAVAWLTPRVFSDVPKLRFHFLEAMGFCLITDRHLVGIHAACLARHGCGMLFWGESGAGKSTLAYALAKRGWTYVSDDGSFLLRHGTGREIAGNPERIRFRPAAIELFPELEGSLAKERPNGKLTIEVRTRELPMPARAHATSLQHIVFLKRNANEPTGLRPYPRELALRRLLSSNHYGRASSAVEKEAAIGRILTCGLHQLTYSGLDEAIECLELLSQSKDL